MEFSEMAGGFWLLAALLLASWLLIGLLAWRLRRLAQAHQAAARRLDELERELRGLSNGALGVGRKLLKVEERLRESEKQIQDLSLSDPVKLSYSEAARLLEMGADIDDLVANCGLSRPEAELVSALHRQRSSAP